MVANQCIKLRVASVIDLITNSEVPTSLTQERDVDIVTATDSTTLLGSPLLVQGCC